MSNIQLAGLCLEKVGDVAGILDFELLLIL